MTILGSLMLSGLLCSAAYAETYFSKKPVICGTIENVVDTSKKWEELPFLRAQGTTMQDDGSFAPSTYIIGHNKETGTWSLMEVLPTGHACLLASGKGIELFAEKLGISL